MSTSEPPSGKELQPMIAAELEHVRARKGLTRETPLVALALSGGGVRSAATSLGFLKELSRLGVLENIDYLSTVSGAGYASSYLYSAADSFGGVVHEQLFGEDAQRELVGTGNYLALGKGRIAGWRVLRLLGSVISMGVLNLSCMALLLIVLALAASCATWFNKLTFSHTFFLATLVGAGMALLRLTVLGIFSWRRPPNVPLHKAINYLEGVILTIIGVVLLLFGVAPWLAGVYRLWLAGLSRVAPWLAELYARWLLWLAELCTQWLLWLAGLFGVAPWPAELYTRWLTNNGPLWLAICAFIVFGLCASDRVVGLNLVFANLIDSAFIGAGRRAAGKYRGRRTKRFLLRDVDAQTKLPYPLYNAALYLRDKKSPDGMGVQFVDYFLLSPRFCGSARVRYDDTSLENSRYAPTSLADAVAISAASLSPLTYGHPVPVQAVMMTLLNLNLGVWLPNPMNCRGYLIDFWPFKYLRMMFGNLKADNRLLYVADGGFIDNLGVFELLRRHVSLIIAVDNTLDPNYEFKNLRNLLARARSELKVSIDCMADAERDIRPSAVTGFARKQSIILRVKSSPDDLEKWESTVVYVKSCLTRPLAENAQPEEEDGATYQTYHAHFPQESTSDQFFDPSQWLAYLTLGRQLATELFDPRNDKQLGDDDLTRDALVRRFSKETTVNTRHQGVQTAQTVRASGGV